MNKLKISALALIVAAWGMPVQAQTVQSLSREVDEMREELQILQRKIYRETSSNDIPTATSSSVQVRLSQFEEQVRDLVGRMDEFDYKLKQIDERFKVMNQDIDVRFKMLEGKPINNTGLGTSAPTAKKYDAPVAKGAPKAIAGESVSGEELAPLVLPKKTEAAKPTVSKQGVKEIYQQGLDNFNASKYGEAEKKFNQVLKDYPKDALAGNAQYWLGEVFYARAEDPKAAVAFGKAYKNYKDGNKGADSIYKLGMTMQKMNKNAEACAAYKSLPTEFPKAEKAVKDKAAAATKKLKCK